MGIALATRYANPPPDDRGGLDRACAEAMRQVWKSFPRNTDVGALFAESLMDLRPWDQWTNDGKPEPGTDEILATLDAMLEIDVNHPFANHLFIHAVEASPHPERAIPHADRMRTLQPALAHHVHMPPHIHIRVGRWDDAVTAYLNAIEADRKYRAVVGPPKDFIIVYVAHDRHMLAYAAMMTGRSELAISQIRAMVAEIPPDFMKEWANADVAIKSSCFCQPGI